MFQKSNQSKLISAGFLAVNADVAIKLFAIQQHSYQHKIQSVRTAFPLQIWVKSSTILSRAKQKFLLQRHFCGERTEQVRHVWKAGEYARIAPEGAIKSRSCDAHHQSKKLLALSCSEIHLRVQPYDFGSLNTSPGGTMEHNSKGY